ncbi:hypothetical protein KKA85_05860 [bacterium]|nr:hypothetical protein [bacterium]MBU1675289.1 hypothetical protein [bacterium]
MKNALRLTMLALLLGLLSAVAYAQDPGPGYGMDPDLDPPRAGVGNANSGNHNMNIHSYWYRWGTAEDLLCSGFGASTQDPIQAMDGFCYGPGDGTGYMGEGPGDGTGFGPGTGECTNDGSADGVCSRRLSKR